MRPRSVSRMPFERGVTRLLTAFAALMGTVWPSSGSPSARVLSSRCFRRLRHLGRGCLRRTTALAVQSNRGLGTARLRWDRRAWPRLPPGFRYAVGRGLEPAGRALSPCAAGATRLARRTRFRWRLTTAPAGRVHDLHASVAPRAERARARDRARVLHGLVPGARNGPAADRGRAHPAAGLSGARHEPAAGARRASRCPPAHLIRRSRLVLKARSLTEHEPRPPCSVRAR